VKASEKGQFVEPWQVRSGRLQRIGQQPAIKKNKLRTNSKAEDKDQVKKFNVRLQLIIAGRAVAI
jgi:hypothetical protein